MFTGVKRVALVLSVLASVSWAGSISGNVADYNAAKVLQANGVLVVPAALV